MCFACEKNYVLIVKEKNITGTVDCNCGVLDM